MVVVVTGGGCVVSCDVVVVLWVGLEQAESAMTATATRQGRIRCFFMRIIAVGTVTSSAMTKV